MPAIVPKPPDPLPGVAPCAGAAPPPPVWLDAGAGLEAAAPEELDEVAALIPKTAAAPMTAALAPTATQVRHDGCHGSFSVDASSGTSVSMLGPLRSSFMGFSMTARLKNHSRAMYASSKNVEPRAPPSAGRQSESTVRPRETCAEGRCDVRLRPGLREVSECSLM